MSCENIKQAVIEYLQQKEYKYVKSLGQGAFGCVIAVVSPKKEVVAVKMIQEKYIGVIEDQVWPTLCHRNILPVMDMMQLENPSVKLYVIPMLPKCLFSFVQTEEFKNDTNSFTKIRLWMYDVLLALEYLHSNGFCHCDMKSDNVLLDEDERAVVCDFSGLNYTKEPLKSVCSPAIFRPPEWFKRTNVSNVQGAPYDMYTFGMTALNLLTGHWPQIKLMEIGEENLSWPENVLPILETALKEPNLDYLMRKAFPKATISERDVEKAKDFLQYLLHIEPGQRLTARSSMQHPFLKMGENPFKPAKHDFIFSSGDNLITNPDKKTNGLKVSDYQCISAHEAKKENPGDDKIKNFLPNYGAKPKNTTICNPPKFSRRDKDNLITNHVSKKNGLKVNDYQHIRAEQQKIANVDKIKVFLPKSGAKNKKGTSCNSPKFSIRDNIITNPVSFKRNGSKVNDYQRISEDQDNIANTRVNKMKVFLLKPGARARETGNRNSQRLTQDFDQQQNALQCPSTEFLIENGIYNRDVKQEKNYIPKKNIRKSVTDWFRRKLGISQKQ